MVLILSDLEWWKVEMTLEQPIGFEPGISGCVIQRLNH